MKVRAILLIGILIILLAGLMWYFSTTLEPKSSAARNAFFAAAAGAWNKSFDAQTQTKAAGCQVSGSLPDPQCTPGAIFPEAGVTTICISGYTKEVRNVPVSLKKKIYEEYSISYPQPTGTYELDHLIPLELGGNNDPANLFPEAAQPTPGFHEKDLVENYLHQEVCAGKIPLAFAQEEIARNWVAVYEALSPREIDFLRSQFSGN